jgi:hypothetical protein
MTKILADALVPIFAGLLIGYFAGLWRRMDNQNVRTLITFVMSFAVPCSLFMSIAQTPRAELREQAGAALVLTIVYAGSFQPKAGHLGECRPGADGQFSKFGCGGTGITRFGLRAKVPSDGSNLHCSGLHNYFCDHPGDP